MSEYKPKRVIIVGIGGIGSWLAEGIIRMLEFKLKGTMLILVDGDHFETKNAERQSFVTLGNKAEIKANEIQKFFPGTFVAPVGKWIVESVPGEDNQDENAIGVHALLQDNDVVFAVVDNFAARALLFNAAQHYENIDVFTGGNDDKLFGSVYHYQRREGADVTDHPTVFHPEYVEPPDRNPATMSCQERAELEGGTQLIATNMAVVGWLLGRFQHTVIEGNHPAEAADLMFDLGAGAMQRYARDATEVDEETLVEAAV